MCYCFYYLQNGTTPLHTASNRGHTEVVQVLLSNGAPLEAKNNVSITELSHTHTQQYCSIINVTHINN